ncbi:MAG: hypothetical protein ACR2Q4_01480 [Geminicoccaceae bacterium]
MLGDSSLPKTLSIDLQPLAISLLIPGLIGLTAGVAGGLNRLTAALIPLLIFAHAITRQSYRRHNLDFFQMKSTS